MIFAKATLYVINPEKIKPFVDYLYVLTKKIRMVETNLSFEYGLRETGEIVVLERWSTRDVYNQFMTNKEFADEFETLSKMAKKSINLYEMDTVK
ncbi:antibiotic biosynthesis monooxygenase [Mycoplasma sp. NEAQ87857]|uniref:antibiotic biosynthesis monooxygenase n=1 Tax=Mycoplasma sp. NEAQ87857 TaxID=2683967 RepID=UPI0013167ECF|nr:antibiotic biosynthesis monooxygenase [Mycoplasma sp. NEAQ87857]QGZ97313.1 antibiotic biosynthesis monooxygenase [Mycoplasma sp. NEAQ87857]